MQINNLLLVTLLVLLSGCGTTEPVIKVETQIVKVPVPVACKEEKPPVPEYCFPKLTSNQTIYEKTRCLLSDKQLREAYEIKLSAALQACK